MAQGQSHGLLKKQRAGAGSKRGNTVAKQRNPPRGGSVRPTGSGALSEQFLCKGHPHAAVAEQGGSSALRRRPTSPKIEEMMVAL